MSALYVYDFGDEKYMVDDSGERWTIIDLKHTTVYCDSCHNAVMKAVGGESRHIMCWDCVDAVNIDLTKHRGNLLDFGAGEYKLINAHTRNLKTLGMKIQEYISGGYLIIKTTDGLSEWRDIVFNGVIFGMSYVGDIVIECEKCGEIIEDEKDEYYLPHNLTVCMDCYADAIDTEPGS